VEAVMSLVESMKDLQDASPQTMENVKKMVTSIIELLEADVNRTKVEQDAAKTELGQDKATAQNGAVTQTVTTYNKLKASSKGGQDCHEAVTQLQDDFLEVHKCSQGDIEESACDCTVNSVHDFSLTETAKALHWCDFSAQQTSQTCINQLWAEVNATRASLKSKHSAWKQEKQVCENKRAQCLHCRPKDINIKEKDAECKGRHQGIYDEYDTFQIQETSMCNADEALANRWTVQSGLQSSRVEEWSDLRFVICIFKDFKTAFNFTQESFDACKNKNGEADFYTFAGGQLQEPVLDMTEVPACDRQRPNKDATVSGLDGLLWLWALDKCGEHAQVTITTGNTFQPVVDCPAASTN